MVFSLLETYFILVLFYTFKREYYFTSGMIQTLFLLSFFTSNGTKSSHRELSEMNKRNEEIVSLSFRSKLHVQIRQCELKRYRNKKNQSPLQNKLARFS